MSENKKSRLVKKPGRLIYFLAYCLILPFLKIKCKAVFDRSGLAGLAGPALVLCPHISNMDFLLVAAALYPQRPTFVVSEHFMKRAAIRRALSLMHVIPKKMFCPDIRTIKSILNAKESGNVIVLFPEGRLTCVGHSLDVTEGTSDLVKKLGVDVYTVTGNGAYKTLPKWGKAGFRPGRIEVVAARALTAEQIAGMSVAEIETKIQELIFHDEDKLFTDISYRCKAPALGLDGVLYQCPRCKEEFALEAAASTMVCRACGASYSLNERYELTGGPFRHINDWYFWEASQIDVSRPLESKTIVATPDENGNIVWDAGRGFIRLDKDEISFRGEVFGQPLEFREKLSTVKALPVSVGHHFDLYHKKVLYNFILQPDPRAAVKWSLYADKVNRK